MGFKVFSLHFHSTFIRKNIYLLLLYASIAHGKGNNDDHMVNTVLTEKASNVVKGRGINQMQNYNDEKCYNREVHGILKVC